MRALAIVRCVVKIFICAGIAILLAFWGTPNMRSSSEADNRFVLRGTLNVALANKNGFVVVTDSMVTEMRGTEMHQLATPGQKLFRLDERTVCTIAGFGSATIPTAPEFNTSAAGKLERFRNELVGKSGSYPISEKLTSLSFLLNFYLSSFANIRDVVQGDVPPGHYAFELILAGFDHDGSSKLGRLSLRTVVRRGADGQPTFTSFTEHISERSVGKELAIETAGQDDVAQEILQYPENFTSDPAIRRYAESIRSDHGSSLTIQEMKQLAEALVRHTEQRYPSVGGPRQIAILEYGQVASIEQPDFPVRPSPVREFNLVVGNHLEGPRSIVFENASGLFVRNHFRRDVRTLDGHYFFGNEFIDSQLRYDGGFTRFDSSNHVVGSVLLIGPRADPNSDLARQLVNGFPWRAVCYLRQE